MQEDNRMIKPHLTTASLALLVCTALGCKHLPDVGGIGNVKADPELAEKLAPEVYPDAPEALGEDLDMIAERNGRMLTVRNFEPRSFDNVQVWVNQEWVGEVEQIAIGSGNRFDLTKFINGYGEVYPVGSWLSPDKALRVALVEIYDPETGKRHRIVVHTRRRVLF